MKYYDAKGATLSIGKVVGQGGQAKVFQVLGNASLKVYAKVWNDDVQDRQELIAKAMAMTQACPHELMGKVAWPISTLHSHRSQPACGFTMQAFEQSHPLHDLTVAKYRKKKFPDANWGCLVTAAVNLAALFERCHSLNIVIGDVSASNIRVDSVGRIRLIDCDSWQVRMGTQAYLCPVLTPEFAAPELNGVDLRKHLRTCHHDCFALAILIFQMLFNGRHPFSDPGGDLQKAIALNTTLLRGSHDRQFYPGILPRELPNSLQRLFELAFDPKSIRTGRPTAREWKRELKLLGRRLVKCPHESHHVYLSNQKSCPWCEVDNALGKGFAFPSSPTATRVNRAPTPGTQTTTTASIERIREELSMHVEEIEKTFQQVQAMSAVAVTTPLKPSGMTGHPLPSGFLSFVFRWTIGMGRELSSRKLAVQNAAVEVQSASKRFYEYNQKLHDEFQQLKSEAVRFHARFQDSYSKSSKSLQNQANMQEVMRWLVFLRRTPPTSLHIEMEVLKASAADAENRLLHFHQAMRTLQATHLQGLSQLAQVWFDALQKLAQAEADLQIMT